MAEYSSTTNQGLTIPDDNDSYLRDVPDYIKALAEDVELRVVMRFATMAEFTAKVTSPVNGMLFWVEADFALYVYADEVNRVWPTVPKFSWGSEEPTGPGEAGEFYYQTGE